MTTRTPSQSRGFTLMEMLFALLMGAIVVTPLYVVTRAMAEKSSVNQMEVEASQRARLGLHTLLADLSRTGLNASPYPFMDPRSMLFNSTANNIPSLHRRVVVHMSAGADSRFDSIAISGNFLGGKMYQAVLTDPTQVKTLPGWVADQKECDQFKLLDENGANQAFIHLEGPTNKSFDSLVSGDPAFEDQVCTVTLATPVQGNGMAPGDPVVIGANQTVLYRVEGGDLVRYFAAYDGTSVGVCDNLIIPIPITRQVVAELVAEFQVWFRPAQLSAGALEVPIAPNYYTPDAVVAADEEFVPGRAAQLFPATLGDTPNAADLTCAAAGSGLGRYAAQHVRAAAVRIAVRTDFTDPSLSVITESAADGGVGGTDGFDTEASHYLEHSLIGYACSPPNCVNRPGSAFKLKTYTTEVAMPNLAARSDIPL